MIEFCLQACEPLGEVAHILIAASFMTHGRYLSLEGSVITWVPATFFAWILVTSLVSLWPQPKVGRLTVS